MKNKMTAWMLAALLGSSFYGTSVYGAQAEETAHTTDLKAVVEALQKDVASGKIKPEAAKLTSHSRLWLPEFDAITSYEASPEAAQDVTVSRQRKINRLDEVGSSYTADNLDPVDQYDFVVGDWRLKQSINDIAKEPPESVSKNDFFTTYTYPGVEATVYSGPAPTDKQKLDPLQAATSRYNYEVGDMTNLHVTDKGLTTIRDIGVGNSRGEVVFSYGAPNAMWRNAKTGDIYFAYTWDAGTLDGRSRTTESNAVPAISSDRSYLVFTFHDSKVKALDFIDGQVWTRFNAPDTTMRTYKVNVLTDDDFVLRGRRLGDYFVNDGDETWRTQGDVYGSPFIGYDDYAVSAGDDHLINRIYVNHDTPTRRGICIGDTSYLMLFVYGRPYRVQNGFEGNPDMRVYEYRNPNKKNEYLLFVVDGKTKFIKNIMLSDRAAEQLH
mgnify:CR=1 FL=1